MDNKTIRYNNVRYLVDLIGGVSNFAEKIDKGQSQVSQFAGSNPIKGIGNKIAREIEIAFLKDHGWLDVAHPELWESQGDMHPAQSQRMGDMMQSQGTPVIKENFLTQSPRSHALNALINKLDELEQQHLISEDEVSLLKHTLDVLAKSKSSSTNARQPQNPIFKDEE